MEEPNVQARRKDVGIDRPFDAVIIVTQKELRCDQGQELV